MRSALYVAGLVAIGTALRRQGDLGPLLSPLAFWLLLCAGCGLVLAAASMESRPAPRLGWTACLALAFGSVWCVLAGDGPGIAIAAVGSITVGLAGFERTNALARRFGVLATALVVALGASHATLTLDLVRVPLGWVAATMAGVLRIFGADATASDDLVIVEGLISHVGLRLTPFTLGLAVHGLVAAHSLLMTWTGTRLAGLRTGAWRPLAYFGVATLLRFALLAATSVTLETTRDFEDENFPLQGMLDARFGLAFDLVAALVAARLFLRAPGQPFEPASEPPVTAARAWPALAAALVAGSFFASDRVLDCAGTTKPGRVAIDEGHSQWEATDLELGRDYYGTESGYNYRALVEWLEVGYGPVRRLYDAITPALLRDVDVLVVKTPTAAFGPQEAAAIQQWVREGGGLVLIGDHTNVFGTSAILNALAVSFGFHYDYDCLFDQQRRFEELYTVEPGLARHPILRAVDTLRFEVGCSIDIDSPDVRPVIVGRGLKSQTIDYRIANFYPKPRDQSQMRCGAFAQLVTRSFGRGRVVAVSDSTLLSTFSICIPGRRELIEGMLAYANRVDAGEDARRVAHALAWLAAIALLAMLRERGALVAAAALTLVIGSTRASIVAAEAWLYPGHPTNVPGRASHELWFQRTPSVDWAVERFVQNHERTYDVFFQYVTRTRQFPRLVEDFETCMASDAPLVLIDPEERDVARATQELLEGVRRGRSVIVMESRANAFVDALAGPCGFGISAARDGDTTVRTLSAHGPIVAQHFHPCARDIRGGAALLVEERAHAGEPNHRAVVAAVVRLGAGQVALVTNGACFANAEYGYSYSLVPDSNQRRMYEVEYDLVAAACSE